MSWPEISAALDEQLDSSGVIAQTGCTAEDLIDLAQIFLQEVDNMRRRLQKAADGLAVSQPGTEDWPLATEALRTAAHELTTSFGILGARRAEAYARHTQLRLRKAQAGGEPPPTAPELRQAVQALLGAVHRVEGLIRRTPT